MSWAGIIVSLALIVIIFIDTFEVVILPRRVRHSYRLARLFYRSAWSVWPVIARVFPTGRWRNGFLSVFGPLSLFLLLTIWAFGLIFGFALLHWSLNTAMAFPHTEEVNFASFIYFSGTTFFTLGYGDAVPLGALGRALSVAEAGIGFGFLAMVISYLPVLYQAFSRREIIISLLDSRAGSPPTAGELLRRMLSAQALSNINQLLIEWERWAAELLESHLSYPVLSYYRSQHDNQSWVGTLATILDTSALLIVFRDGPESYQARLTFAMARHAAVDLAMVFQSPPLPPRPDRLPEEGFAKLRALLEESEKQPRDESGLRKSLSELRGLYEPILNALAHHFQLALPPFQPDKPPVDNWQTSPWLPRAPALTGLSEANPAGEHHA
jgi:hypothetical protein